ncbi:MAG: flavodoxin-dependent (E)-4-hydroxy-3-methylbut-2-enyl-diphosphate synthase [Kiritimatiellia bacterium]
MTSHTGFPARRRPARRIRVGDVPVGGGAPISVQTMTKTDTRDVKATVRQIQEAEDAGCDIIRVAVPDEDSCKVLGEITQKSPIPIVADVHFDYRLAVKSAEAGAAALRLNPGNIGKREDIRKITSTAAERGIPIRIGVNSGSLQKDIAASHGGTTAEALVESALRNVKILEDLSFDLIKISVKASDVARTVTAYRLLSDRVDYPLHLGVTEAGTFLRGTVASSTAMGILLAEGIGDTIRISLTDSPAREVAAAVELLRCLGLRAEGPSVISCPTCGRAKVDVQSAASGIERELSKYYRANPTKPRPRVAVMGCVVNGPGEAKEADIGLAGGEGKFALFVNGKACGAVSEAEAAEEVVRRVRKWRP